MVSMPQFAWPQSDRQIAEIGYTTDGIFNIRASSWRELGKNIAAQALDTLCTVASSVLLRTNLLLARLFDQGSKPAYCLSTVRINWSSIMDEFPLRLFGTHNKLTVFSFPRNRD
jgi:hypothetical protein